MTRYTPPVKVATPIRSLPLLPLLSVLALAACSTAEQSFTPAPEDLIGSWRAVLASPGGELPFAIEIEPERDGYRGVAINGDERVPFSDVTFDGQRVRLVHAWYDSRIEAEFDGSPDRLTGVWSKTVPAGVSSLPFTATRGGERRFQPIAEAGLEPGEAAALPAIDGVWEAVFEDDDGVEPARGEFRQDGTRVEGTFLTPTGDYRFLEGSYEQGLLRLSTFDGGHAFLFQARARADGTLAGDFWSRDTYHATWTATRADPTEAVIPDAWELVGLTDEDGRLEFTFPDLNGVPVSLSDERFRGKVVVVNIFGSWCPNCNDEAPLLADWARLYRGLGLEVVGLAYEYSDDVERSRRMVQRFAARHRIDYPLLIAGISDKSAAGETLPDLTSVVAYPTTIFVDRAGKVRKIHSGFSGPGTGEHYERLVAEMVGLIEQLLAE